tara:strand:- start:2603 stop:2827 length:225 start_codon:yes stop_codon:yes gene_type:complete
MSPSLENFVKDWSITLAMGGGICALIGLVAGWIIWKNARRFTERLEADNRDAIAEYERTSDEISKIRAELTSED